MKKSAPFILLYFLISVAIAQSGNEKWSIKDNSTLNINGKSNINTFQCSYEKAFQSSQVLVEDSLGTLLFTQGMVFFEVASFRCGHARMTADFRQTMKAKSYPLLKMEISKIVQTEEGCVMGLLLTVAGQKRAKQIALEVCKVFTNQMIIEGRYTMKMRDYGLTPPNVLWGMIKVSDEIEIDFSFYLENK
jgi:hypothetical protein